MQDSKSNTNETQRLLYESFGAPVAPVAPTQITQREWFVGGSAFLEGLKAMYFTFRKPGLYEYPNHHLFDRSIPPEELYSFLRGPEIEEFVLHGANAIMDDILRSNAQHKAATEKATQERKKAGQAMGRPARQNQLMGMTKTDLKKLTRERNIWESSSDTKVKLVRRIMKYEFDE